MKQSLELAERLALEQRLRDALDQMPETVRADVGLLLQELTEEHDMIRAAMRDPGWLGSHGSQEDTTKLYEELHDRTLSKDAETKFRALALRALAGVIEQAQELEDLDQLRQAHFAVMMGACNALAGHVGSLRRLRAESAAILCHAVARALLANTRTRDIVPMLPDIMRSVVLSDGEMSQGAWDKMLAKHRFKR